MPALAAGLLFPLFVSLGFWQLHRADEKEALIALRLARSAADELPLGREGVPSLGEVRFRHVNASGTYQGTSQILLDNQIVDHRPGYFVLTPLRFAAGGPGLLVNRGWVPAAPDRSELPEVGIDDRAVRVRGVVAPFPSVGWRLKGAEIPTPGSPGVVQILDADALSRHIGYPILPYQVLLGPAEPYGYVRNWHAADPDPNKNRGYALQWFSFAAVLLVLFFRYGFHPRPRDPV